MVKLSAQVVDIKKDYVLGGGVVVNALRGVSIDFPEGDFVAIIGASGSGKSTMLNLLGCLDRPTAGRYILAGRDVSRLSDDELSEIRSRHLGFIFQSYNLIQQLTVVENIELPLYYQGNVSRRRASNASGWPKWLAWPTGSTTGPSSFPAGSSNAWPSPGRWSTTPKSSWRTSRPEISIRPPATRSCRCSKA